MSEVFISYRHMDADFAHRLADALAECLIADVFIDRYMDGAVFPKVLETHIRQCAVFVLCVTPNTFHPARLKEPNDWVRKEIQLALRLQKKIALAIRDPHFRPKEFRLPQSIAPILDRHGIPFFPPELYDKSVELLGRHIETISDGQVIYLYPGEQHRRAELDIQLPVTPPMPHMATWVDEQRDKNPFYRLLKRILPD